MTDPKAAAERIVEWAEQRSFGPITEFDKDAVTLALAYLALTADKGAGERAREIVDQLWLDTRGKSHAGKLIVAALSAAEARERERCLSACNAALAYCPKEQEPVVRAIESLIRGGDNG